MVEKLLITGGCGFVGTNLAHFLNERGGYALRVLDNESLGKREYLNGLDVEFIHGDIRDRDLLNDALDGVDCVIHLAADTRVMDSIRNPDFNFDVNVVGTYTLLSVMREKNIKRMVNASTGGAIIGDADPPVHESMLPSPVSAYGAAKLAVEGYLHAFSQSYGFSAVSLRFSNVYGPHSYHKGSVVARFMKRILNGEALIVYGDGSQTRDYVHADDICRGIHAAISRRASGVYQLGTGRPTSINQLIALISDIVGPQYPVRVAHTDFRAGEVRQTWCDIAKAGEALGYRPLTSLKAGLVDTWRWFTDHRLKKSSPSGSESPGVSPQHKAGRQMGRRSGHECLRRCSQLKLD